MNNWTIFAIFIWIFAYFWANFIIKLLCAEFHVIFLKIFAIQQCMPCKSAGWPKCFYFFVRTKIDEGKIKILICDGHFHSSTRFVPPQYEKNRRICLRLNKQKTYSIRWMYVDGSQFCAVTFYTRSSNNNKKNYSTMFFCSFAFYSSNITLLSSSFFACNFIELFPTHTYIWTIILVNLWFPFHKQHRQLSPI